MNRMIAKPLFHRRKLNVKRNNFYASHYCNRVFAFTRQTSIAGTRCLYDMTRVQSLQT